MFAGVTSTNADSSDGATMVGSRTARPKLNLEARTSDSSCANVLGFSNGPSTSEANLQKSSPFYK
ncbi:MAG: hypothetical protein DWQ42_22435 [Planctomycetota bacterium]|nr:MAG: hypothetical protein DWQ42_22435 [Planctomycetota bacterium]